MTKKIKNTNYDKDKVIDIPVDNLEVITPDTEVFTVSDSKFLANVKNNLKVLYTNTAAKEFINNPEFQVKTSNSEAVWRGLVNRVLINKLLQHRAISGKSVVDVVYCLSPDGDNASWMNVFKLVIIPYLKENKVKL